MGGATANPAVGFGVGVATAAASDYAIRTVSRHWHQGEQDAIAAAAGSLPVGAIGPWRVVHSLPFGNEHGQLQVVRAIDNPLAACRQVLFSVEAAGEAAAWYSVDVCQQAARLEMGQRRTGGGALGLPAVGATRRRAFRAWPRARGACHDLSRSGPRTGVALRVARPGLAPHPGEIGRLGEVSAPDAGPTVPPKPGNVVGSTPVRTPRYITLGPEIEGAFCKQFGFEFRARDLPPAMAIAGRDHGWTTRSGRCRTAAPARGRRMTAR